MNKNLLTDGQKEKIIGLIEDSKCSTIRNCEKYNPIFDYVAALLNKARNKGAADIHSQM